MGLKFSLLLFLFAFSWSSLAQGREDDSLSMEAGDYSIIKHQLEMYDIQCMALDRVSAIKGSCFWLKCKLFACSIKMSLIIEHRSPDLLFEVRASEKESVIEPINWYTSINQSISQFLLWGMGVFADGNVNREMRNNKTSSGTRISTRKDTDNLNFYDVTVIGNPYLMLYEEALDSVLDNLEITSFCKSDVTPFQPYYVSISDPEWRFGLVERMLSLYDSATSFTGTRDINNYNLDITDPVAAIKRGAGVYWGYIYPRMGYVKSQSMYRSAALMAQRAADVNTGNHGLHIPNTQWPPTEPSDRGSKVWKIPPVVERDGKHKWQLNYPQGKRTGCYQFPDEEIDNGNFEENSNSTEADTNFITSLGYEIEQGVGGITSANSSTASPSSGKDNLDTIRTDLLSPSNTYIWTLWRTYKCCKDKGSYLFKVEI